VVKDSIEDIHEGAMAIVYSFEPFFPVVKIIAREFSREGPCAKEQ
jgi:hypothetical protein